MASHVHSNRPTKTVGALRKEATQATGGVSAFLAAAIVVSVPLTPLTTISLPSGALSITWLMIFTSAAMLVAMASFLMNPAKPPVHKSVRAASAAAILLMLPSAIFSSEGAPGYLAYVNFVVGICAGVRVATVWASLRLRSTNVIDLAIYVFVVTTVAQLMGSFSVAEDLNSLHQNARTPWGNSNYVAGVLVVTGMLIIGRAQLMLRGRGLAYMIALLGFASAVLTLSRGGVTALAVGVAAALWMLPKGLISKFILRTCALTIPVVAWFAIDAIQIQRAQVNSQVFQNVDTRFGLWSLAWESFLDSPVFGSGWAYFRTISSDLEQQTFAHNFFLSYLQIGGLIFGVPFIIIIIAMGLKSVRRLRPVAPALFAIFAIAQTDPLIEGTVGGMTAWMAITLAFAVPSWARTDKRSSRAGCRP